MAWAPGTSGRGAEVLRQPLQRRRQRDRICARLGSRLQATAGICARLGYPVKHSFIYVLMWSIRSVHIAVVPKYQGEGKNMGFQIIYFPYSRRTYVDVGSMQQHDYDGFRFIDWCQEDSGSSDFRDIVLDLCSQVRTPSVCAGL